MYKAPTRDSLITSRQWSYKRDIIGQEINNNKGLNREGNKLKVLNRKEHGIERGHLRSFPQIRTVEKRGSIFFGKFLIGFPQKEYLTLFMTSAGHRSEQKTKEKLGK